ncbi:hypothetical protein K2173_024809 [Erythroxylum novogranatense]|uniref:Subtilisin-like protease SBT1.1 n=1 Tax=Erythroxylum novogranatense TaxID=1862640 RepID=A0AAV8UCH4_9ROSI|nr:hypothetical protein K2173_024809 [Erythroxylum novogranatense]
MTAAMRLSLFLMLLMMFMAMDLTAAKNEKTYVIHMDKSKIPDAIQSAGSFKQWYESVIASSISGLSAHEDDEEEEETETETETNPPQLLYVYKTVISGFAAKLSDKQVNALSKADGFHAAIPDEILTLHTTHSPQFLGLQNGKGLWTSQNMHSDVIIGVLDTGIWPEHVSFDDSGIGPVPSRWKGTCENGTGFTPANCNRKLIGARTFYKGYEAIFGKINETVDYKSPRDAQGHGTHTASTAGGNLIQKASFFGVANGSASGMRYTARIAAYKVCWSSGCINTDLLAAIDKAVSDGVDVLSLSLGGTPKPYYSDGIAIASFGAISRGVFVSCSAGNSGPFGSTVGNTAPWIMTVAASYTDRSFPTTVKLGNGAEFTGSSLNYGKTTKQLPLVYAETAGIQRAEYCVTGSLDRKLVEGKIVVCDRGLNSRTQKGEVVKLAKGAGMILVNSEREGEELIAHPHVLAATTVGYSAGKAIKLYLNSTRNATVSIAFRGTVYGDLAPKLAVFSSRGPSLPGPEVIKPDVTAPGVNILAAWPPATSPSRLKSDRRSLLFNIASGTSMACPHVSGLASLLKSAHRDWSPAAIKSALMTTSYTLDSRNVPISDVGSNSSASATPFGVGSGHVDPESASDPGLIYDITTEDYLSYLCSLNYTSSQVALVSRKSFNCPKLHQPGDLNYPSFAVILPGNAEKPTIKYKRTVTNVGMPTSTYAVQVDEPDGVSVTPEPKTLRFSKLGQKLSYSVNFVGLVEKDTRGVSSFGSIVWVSGKYKVRSPIAVTWE